MILQALGIIIDEGFRSSEERKAFFAKYREVWNKMPQKFKGFKESRIWMGPWTFHTKGPTDLDKLVNRLGLAKKMLPQLGLVDSQKQAAKDYRKEAAQAGKRDLLATWRVQPGTSQHQFNDYLNSLRKRIQKLAA